MFCALCKGKIKNGRVNFPVDVGNNFILIKDVPALVCEQCGEYFLEDDVAGVIEEIINDAKSSNVEFEILKFAA
ncbi:MAG: type II toxin-antitoxin system MqsA family antitoxin [Thermodesulfobacteriota bacterium]|nr:type II toxin-antitoxin system MqsA family antitoxin [Thermodesulfobacteriota bacterium]